ncbi:UNVERIFIED_CONTAM: hypothetical protein ABIC26_003266 [Paenibacillus sp. PvR008]
MINITLASIIYILLMIWGLSYVAVYLIKKKKNTHGQSGYKIFFLVILVFLVIALVSSFL